MLENKVKILVVTHKPVKVYHDDVYIPIQVGRNLSEYELNWQGDNTGDNISDKNLTYCELTAQYWAWKNLKGVEYIGLCHYRRYFDFHRQGKLFLSQTNYSDQIFSSLDLSIPDTVFDYIDEGKIVLAKPVNLRESVYVQYCLKHISDDLRILEKVVKETGEMYDRAFRKVVYESHKFSPFNMFIMRWDEFECYCDWLFQVLKSVEERIDISCYNMVQKRVYGYMAERLLNVYVEAHGLSIRYYPVICLNNEKNECGFYAEIQNMCKNLSFTFSLHSK